MKLYIYPPHKDTDIGSGLLKGCTKVVRRKGISCSHEIKIYVVTSFIDFSFTGDIRL